MVQTEQHEIIAMILAGGQGARLGVLTKHSAKPAVPFGSRHRIIDFPLSNCTNSGINTVGVLTQYQPLVLNAYVGNGQNWAFDRNEGGGAFILPPYQSNSSCDWYTGTANAIYQNIDFIEDYNPQNVLILSGDHVYKMDYAKMLNFHQQQNADATIAVFEVPWDEASRFGIMNTDADSRIVEFEEKPKMPKNNLASMGVYIFKWDVLRQLLTDDETDSQSHHDFGKNIIPSMLSAGFKLSAYRFSGYWKDVGTIDSLWEANMDTLDRPEEIDLSDRNWRVYSGGSSNLSRHVSVGTGIENSAVTEGCDIYGSVEHSILSAGVTVERGAVVRDSILMAGVTVQAGAFLDKCIVGTGTIIGKNVRAGASIKGESKYLNTMICSNGITVFERGIKIRDNAIIPANCMVECPAGIGSDEIIEYHFRVKRIS